jgi:hypothetical protein
VKEAALQQAQSKTREMIMLKRADTVNNSEKEPALQEAQYGENREN